MKRVTIYDVAKEANVSLATVSRVINGSSVVKEPTRKKVQQAIEKLGYKPNALAQGLALQKTTTIGLVVPETGFNYIGQILNGLLDVAKIYHYSIILHTTTAGLNDLNDVVETLLKSHVDGVIIFNDKSELESYQLLQKYGIPIVVIGSKVSGEKIASVYMDMEAATYQVASMYAKAGIKDVIILEDRRNPQVSMAMKDGASKAFEEVGKTYNGFIRIPSNCRSTFTFLKEYLSAKRHSVMIAHRDSQAMAICNAARECGLKVPDDIEVVCMYDSKYNSMYRPQISAIAFPSYDIGAVSMRLMTKMLKDEPIDNKTIELGFIYTPRQSTKHER